VEIVQKDQNIPIEPVTTKEEQIVQVTDIKDLLPKSSEMSIVAEPKQETTSEEKTTEDEAEHLTTEALTKAVREITATPVTSQLPSHHVTTETTEFVEKQVATPSTDFIDESVVENLRTQQKNVDKGVR